MLFIVIPIIIILAGIGYYFCLPRYEIIQSSRALAWGNNPSDFIMSPAKIKITNLVWGFPLTIPVKITNDAGEMMYLVSFQDPSLFDKGYTNADGINDYSYSWGKSTILVKDNSTEVIKIKVKKDSLFAKGKLEKGIAISQNPPASGMANIGFSYVFEILTK
jgi:hypothetical protein